MWWWWGMNYFTKGLRTVVTISVEAHCINQRKNMMFSYNLVCHEKSPMSHNSDLVSQQLLSLIVHFHIPSAHWNQSVFGFTQW